MGYYIDLDKNTLLTAHFTGNKKTIELEISEINYNSDRTISSGDWFELHNISDTDIDISGYSTQDALFTNSYTFPSSTIIKKNNYLVLCSDLVKFKLYNPTISNVHGPIGYSLNNQSDSIILKDRMKNVIISM